MAAEDPNALALVYNDPANMQLAGTSSQALTIPAPASRVQSNPTSGLKNVPAFLNKLYSMVSDPATDHLIRWTEDGTSFIVPSSEKFGKELLPRFFKHSNFGSFVRQLNMYGFHKVPHLQQGVLKLDDDDEKEKAEVLEFQNDNFQRDQPDLLYLIQRKKGASTAQGARTGSEDPDGKASTPAAGPATSGMTMSKLQADLGHILTEVQAIKRHQAILSSDLRDLQSTNRTLWQENMDQRLKHDKNAEMIDKILKFLAGVFGGRALSEGASFMSGHNIAAADSSSGLGLGSYGQGRTASANGTAGDASNSTTSQHNTNTNGFDFVPPHKRHQRLLLQGSPDKQTTIYDSGPDDLPTSQFEELGSDDDIPVAGKKAGSVGKRRTQSSTSSPQSVDSSRFNEIKSTSANSTSATPSASHSQTQGNPSAAAPPSDNLDVNSLINNDNIDWASINAILNNSGALNGNNSSANGVPQPFDYSNTDFTNFDFSNSGVFGMPSTSSLSNNAASTGSNGQTSLTPYNANGKFPNISANPSTNEVPSYSLALSPANPSFPTSNIDNTQALTKYGDALTHVSDENAKIKERMDNLSSAIDRLVAHLPSGFSFDGPTAPTSTTSAPNNNQPSLGNSNPYDDEFDISQYLNPSSVDLDAEELSNTSQQAPISSQDLLYQFLDTSATSNDASMGNTSLGGTGVPVSSSNPLASIPQTHQFASSAPQGVPASSLDVEQAVKQEPSPSPAPLVEEVLDTSSRPSKASKMPSKTPARASKRRLSTSTNQSSGQAAADPQRRSTRQKTGKA